MAQLSQAVPVQAKNRDRAEGHSAPEYLGTGKVRNSLQMTQGPAVKLSHSGDIIIFGERHEHGIFPAGFFPSDSMPAFVLFQQTSENFRCVPEIDMGTSPEKIISHEYEKNRVGLQNFPRASVH